MKETYTYAEIDKLRQDLEFNMLKRFGISASGVVVEIIRKTFKESLK